jgi:hypothetical protein
VGFDGQIIINANGNGGSGHWSTNAAGIISFADGVASDQFDPRPFYEQNASVVGAGAVGEAPFGVHQTDCLPPHSPDGDCNLSFVTRAWPSSPYGGGTRETIIIRHYGPLKDADGDPETAPVIIELKSAEICSPTPCPGPHGELMDWDDLTEDFHVHVPGNGSREVWIARKLAGSTPQTLSNAYHYRVNPVVVDTRTAIRSDHTFVNPNPNVRGYPYIISPLCQGFAPGP